MMRTHLSYTLLLILFAIFVSNFTPSHAQDAARPTYTILVSEATRTDAEWGKVVTALEAKYAEKYAVSVVVWDPQKPEEILPELRKSTHRYLCFVATPTEADRRFVMIVHQLARFLDDDPYTDAIWAILTGHEAADALRIVATGDAPVKRALGGTSVALENFESGICYNESEKNLKKEKCPGEAPVETRDAPDDTTHAIADALDTADLFVTSGHASERDWNIGYSYPNGRFICKDGQLFGQTRDGERFEIHSSHPKSHLASGNCSIGNILSDGCMAPSLIHCAGVNMMVGYTVPTWFGYMGWGIQDYYIEQPGRFTLAEAFFANNQALTYRLGQADALKLSEQEKQGLQYDQNTVAIYGDPAWQNPLLPKDSGWKQTLTNDSGTWTLTLTPLRGETSFGLLDGNGSQRGGRPVFAFLPYDPQSLALGPVEILEGSEFQPVITENFILVPHSSLPTDRDTVIRFKR